MAKFCKQCANTQPMLVRWVIYNYGRIPWNGFRLPREKKQDEALFAALEAYAERETDGAE